MATTTLSSKGQVVLPRLVRSKLGLSPGARLVCEVRGDSIVLTPEQTTSRSKQFIVDPISGLRVARRSTGAEPVSSEMVRDLMEGFP